MKPTPITPPVDVVEGNKLIAEFVSGDQKQDQKSFWINVPGKEVKFWVNDRDLKYQSSWDWLMPVAQKICELGYTVQWTITDGATCRIWPYLKNIPSCVIIEDRPWTAIVKFIQWYNNQKLKP